MVKIDGYPVKLVLVRGNPQITLERCRYHCAAHVFCSLVLVLVLVLVLLLLSRALPWLIDMRACAARSSSGVVGTVKRHLGWGGLTVR